MLGLQGKLESSRCAISSQAKRSTSIMQCVMVPPMTSSHAIVVVKIAAAGLRAATGHVPNCGRNTTATLCHTSQNVLRRSKQKSRYLPHNRDYKQQNTDCEDE